MPEHTGTSGEYSLDDFSPALRERFGLINPADIQIDIERKSKTSPFQCVHPWLDNDPILYQISPQIEKNKNPKDGDIYEVGRHYRNERSRKALGNPVLHEDRETSHAGWWETVRTFDEAKEAIAADFNRRQLSKVADLPFVIEEEKERSKTQSSEANPVGFQPSQKSP